MKFNRIEKLRWLAVILLMLIFSGAFANHFNPAMALETPYSQVERNIFYRHTSMLFPGNKLLKETNGYQYSVPLDTIIDSLPKVRKNTVIIPFEYKQSALYQPFTFKAIDSVVDILLLEDSVTLSIEGFAHVDEGSDSICYYLSLNRALVIRDYVLGRGIDSSRILSLKGYGNIRSANRKANNQSVEFNCRTELLMNYPLPPPPIVALDKDEDGITDSEDQCPDEYGWKINNGCPGKGGIIVPFEPGLSSLYAMTYRVLDSVITILLQNPSYSIRIEGHACKKEGIETFCDRMAKERADITKRYLLTRNIDPSRIISVNSFGDSRPINACKNPQQIAQNSRSEIYLETP